MLVSQLNSILTCAFVLHAHVVSFSVTINSVIRCMKLMTHNSLKNEIVFFSYYLLFANN